MLPTGPTAPRTAGTGPDRRGDRGAPRQGRRLAPPPFIECRPQRMVVKAIARLVLLGAGVLCALALGGCSLKHPTANLVHGKVLFVAHCGTCHTLAHANTT